MRIRARIILVVVVAMACLAVVSEARPRGKQSRAALKVQAVAAPQKATVKIGNFQFTPKSLTIKAGTTVEWVNEAGRHTVESDTGAFKSGTLADGGRFEFKFDRPGTYPYHCGFHGDKGGKDMAGKIVVTK
jgi:plastocyanin